MEITLQEITRYIKKDLAAQGINVTDELIEKLVNSYNTFLQEKGAIEIG